MSDAEEIVEEEGKEEKKKAAPKKEKLSISAINQQLDDLSFSLGMSFPSFGMSMMKSNYQNGKGGGAGATGWAPGQSSHYSSYMPRSYGPSSNYPKDLVTRKDRPEIVENELETKNRSAQASEASLLGTKYQKQNYGAYESRDVGLQTSESLYSKRVDPHAKRSDSPQDRRRVEFAGDLEPHFKDRGSGTHSHDVSSSQMKLFAKNVQDLYKRKQKAVYGEDEFRTSKK
jgi:hypothetical protein